MKNATNVTNTTSIAQKKNTTNATNTSALAKANIKSAVKAPPKKVLVQLSDMEYPSPIERGPIPTNAHDDHEYSGIVNNDPIKLFGDEDYWRNSPYIPHYFSSTGIKEDRKLLSQKNEYPSPD